MAAPWPAGSCAILAGIIMRTPGSRGWVASPVGAAVLLHRQASRISTLLKALVPLATVPGLWRGQCVPWEVPDEGPGCTLPQVGVTCWPGQERGAYAA